MVKRGNCVRCGAQSIGSNERPLDVSALTSRGTGSLNHSTVQDLCDANTAVERLKAEPFLGVKLSTHFPFTKCVGLPLRTLPGQTPPRITVKEVSWLVQLPKDCGKTPISLCSVESQVSLFETKVLKYVSCRNSDHV